jgi:hypothetical protein
MGGDCENGYFGNWKSAKTNKERKKYAKIISELPKKKGK